MSLSTHWLGDTPSMFLTMQNHNMMAQNAAAALGCKPHVTFFEKLELRIAISLQGKVLYFNDGLAPEIKSFTPHGSIKDHVFSAIRIFTEYNKLNEPQFIDIGFDKPLFQATRDPKMMRLAVLLTVNDSRLADEWIEAHTGGFWKQQFSGDEATASFAFGHELGPAVLTRFRQFTQAYIQSLTVGTQQQQTLAFDLCRNTIELSLQVMSAHTKTSLSLGIIAYLFALPQHGLWLMPMTRSAFNHVTSSKFTEVTVQGRRYTILTTFDRGRAHIMDADLAACNLTARLFHRDGRQNLGYLRAEAARFHQAVALQPRFKGDTGDARDTSPNEDV